MLNLKILNRRLFLFLTLLILTSDAAEARHRVDTYIDQQGVRRVAKTGKIYRDYAAVRDFKRTHPMPKDGRAYDIDHVIPLKDGGADKPFNMQWIRVEDHRLKSAVEK